MSSMFDPEVMPDSWFDVETLPDAWFDKELPSVTGGAPPPTEDVFPYEGGGYYPT